jgi:dienelactone hydrolase
MGVGSERVTSSERNWRAPPGGDWGMNACFWNARSAFSLWRVLLLAALWLIMPAPWQMGLGTGARHLQGSAFGAYGPEGPRMREQFWLLPGADPQVPLRATVFRPIEAGAENGSPMRRPLVVINHGSDAFTREAVAMPVFYWLSRWFVDRGYVVVLPQRRGHGATGGDLAEGRDSCANPDHLASGQAAADDIEAALQFMARQSFVDPSRLVVAGISSGGWAALALAARNPSGLQLVVNFAGGRGGHAYGRSNVVCGQDRLIAAAAALGRQARVPTFWAYAENDSYFGPDVAMAMAAAWSAAGGNAELNLLPAYGADGHAMVDDRASWRLWGPVLERALARYNGDGGATLRVTGVK